MLCYRRREVGTNKREAIITLLYDALKVTAKRFMAQEREGHTWSPTDLLHEALLTVGPDVFARAPNRAYLMGAASIAMRRVLCDHARTRNAEKRGRDWVRTPFDEAIEFIKRDGFEIESLSDALADFKTLSPDQYQIIHLHYFGGFNQEEISEQLGMAQGTVSKERTRTILWLRTHLQK